MIEWLLALILSPFAWLESPLGLAGYLVVAFVIWYIYYSIECGLNGGSLERNPFTMAFFLFWEQLLWSIPGGLQRRTEYVRENVVGDWLGGVCGSKRFWNYAEVREKNLYAECARDVLPTPLYFWLVVVGAPMMWPISLAIVVALILLGPILAQFEFEPLFEKAMDKYDAWKEKSNQEDGA